MSDYTTDGQRVSYGLGHQMGQQMMENPFDGLEVATVMAGLQDAVNGVDCPVSDEDMRAALLPSTNKCKPSRRKKRKLCLLKVTHF